MTNACYRSANCLSKDRPKRAQQFEETLCVHDGSEKGLIVEISDILEQPKSWGVYLSDIGRVIGGQLAWEHGIRQEEVMAEIQKGFNSGNTFLDPKDENKRSTRPKSGPQLAVVHD
jgi:hypothetical protein